MMQSPTWDFRSSASTSPSVERNDVLMRSSCWACCLSYDHVLFLTASSVQLAMGGPLYEESRKGMDSCPQLFPARSTLGQIGGARAEAERFPDLSKGISGVGPLISKQHTVQALVRMN